MAAPRPPLPDQAFDGGIRSAESLGRGLTHAAMPGHPASGSENPAGLAFGDPSGIYSTLSIGETTDIPQTTLDSADPLQDRLLHYISVYAGKGTLFYEPLGRLEKREILNPASPSSDFRITDFAADAFGFAGAQKFGDRFVVGLSLAYLNGTLNTVERQTGAPDQIRLDRGDGLRLNIGLQAFTGRAAWGLAVQNAPGFLWWKDHRRSMLPVVFRIGNAWRLSKTLTFAVEGERRYYKEGGNDEGLIFTGFENNPTENLSLRIGAYSAEFDDPDQRHYTGGISLKLRNGMTVSYALDKYKISEESVSESFLSVRLKFLTDETDAD